jgi:CO/xanthine dehydrogenase Mo-binding subunit
MDTHLTPLAGTTTATRQLYMSGNACLTATRYVKDILARKAAGLLNCQPHELTFYDRKIFYTNDPQRSLPFVTVVAHVSNDGELLFHEGQFNAPFSEVPDLTNIKGRIWPDMTYTAHGAEVAVDEETGEYEVLRIVAAVDCGKAINRNSCEGQIEGGAIYNQGWVMEDLAWKDGITRGNSFATYLMPTALDAPEIETVLLESGGGLGPYGAKGVGEPADNGICPAIVNAIRDAVDVSFFTTLVKAQDVLKAIKAKK